MNKWGISTSVLILFLLLTPTKTIISNDSLLQFDKLVHLLLFGIHTIICFWGLQKYFTLKLIKFPPILAAITYAVAFGWLIEFLQGFMNIGRSFEAMDGVADTIGAVLAGLLALLFSRRKLTVGK